MKESKKGFDKPNYTVNPNLKSYADSPFVKKKMEKAVEILKNLKNPVGEPL